MARRNNNVSDFLSTFKMAYGATRGIQQDMALGDVAKATPTQSEGFTQAQGDELRAAGEAGSEVSYNDTTRGYEVRPQMPEGQMGPGQPKAYAQQGMTDFLGRRYEGQMSEAQINGARGRAYADVISQQDPVRGLQLRTAQDAADRQVKLDGRVDKEYDKKENLESGRRGEWDRLKKLSDEDFGNEIKQFINPHGDVPAMLGYDPKTKRYSIVSDIPGFPTQTLTRAELLQGAMGAWEMGNGDYSAGLKMMLDSAKGGREVENASYARSVQFAGLQQKNDHDQGTLGVQQQNADTSRFSAEQRAAHDKAQLGLGYARLNQSAAQHASRGAGGPGGGKTIKMDVQTLDPITGKSTKVQVWMNPATGAGVTADGKPFTDSKALERAFGRMSEEDRINTGEAGDLQMVEKQAASGAIMPAKGQTALQALEAARNEVRSMYAAKRDRMQFSSADEAERTKVVRGMAQAGAKPAEIAALLGADSGFINQTLGTKAKGTGLPPGRAKDARPQSELQQAYDAWQSAKPSWFQQAGPRGQQAEQEAEARYLELLRNPGRK